MNYTIYNLSTDQEYTIFGNSPEEALSNAFEYAKGNANTWTWKDRALENSKSIIRGKYGIHLHNLSLLNKQKG